LIWTGKCWHSDEAGYATVTAKKAVRRIYKELAGLPEQAQKDLFKWAQRSQSADRVRAMLFLAQSEPGIPARFADFDYDPLLLNCANGTVHLASGTLHPHKRGDLISRMVNIDYEPSSACPTWHDFLAKIMAGDTDTIDFLQRAVGYTLTGNTGEQCLFFLYGTGSNGKSVFLEILKELTGDYGIAASMQTLMVSKQQGIPNDIARLAGKRFVAVGETEDGARLRESLLKDLTGGDTITARFLRHEFFDFRPQFKLWIRGNHKPQIRGTDEGIWRRIHLIPFAVPIPQAERDPQLLDKLRLELPGILAWAVQGCLKYRQLGLRPPKQVEQATKEYREEMDVIGDFLSERCATERHATVSAKYLYQSYRAWCEESGAYPLPQRRFGASLSERGYIREHKEAGSYYRDLRLLAGAL
jgi:putative DNA primase/helicase